MAWRRCRRPAASRHCGAMSASATPARERVLTWPLLAFLAAVAVLVGLGPLTWPRASDVASAVQLLGDGDLDGEERTAVLEQLRGFAAGDPSPFAQWSKLLACIDLGDADGHAAAVQALAGEPWRRLPTAAEQRFLHLGNPLLANVLAAANAEAAGDLAAARQRWQQVAAQARLMAKPLPAALATKALARLR